jgi:hypothetical protein
VENDITHVICDVNITGERVLWDLRWEQFPVTSPNLELLLIVDGDHNRERILDS